MPAPSPLLAASIPALALVVACSASPPPAPPPCPSAAAPAAPTPSAPAPAASAEAADPPLAMAPQQNAASAGLCTLDEMTAARDEIDAVSKLVKALPDDASAPGQVTARIERLLSSKCYSDELALGVDVKELRAARARSLAAWWDEGGRLFLRDALDHGNAIHFAPSVPGLLALEVLPAADPLRAVVCASSAAECDPLAGAAILDLGREIERVKLLRGEAPRGTFRRTDDHDALVACARDTRTHPPAERLFHYSSCVSALVPSRLALPLARYSSPRGWLVLRGRRGHYSFCDEVRAYHLETGSAYIASRCAGLVLGNNGVVDQGATRDAGSVQARTGTLSTDALRRLALALYLKDRVDGEDSLYSKFPLPTGVPMPEPDAGVMFGSGTGIGGSWGHSGQTRLHFEVLDGAATVYTGSFTWPDSADTGEQLADDLVVSAEASFQEGCPRAALPAGLAAPRATGGVSAIDASPGALRKNAEDLASALAGLRKVKLCKK